VVSSHVHSHVALRFYCLFVCSVIQAAMNYENSSEAPRQPDQSLTPLHSHVSESFTPFSGSSHYAIHNLHQTTLARTCTCPCSCRVRTPAATYAYPSYGLTNMVSRTPSGRKRDQQTSNKNNYEISCSGANNTMLSSVCTLDHISLPHTCTSWIVSPLITRPCSPKLSIIPALT